MHFWKMEAMGNDFIFIMNEKRLDYSKLAVDLCERHYGIGADGLIVIDENPLRMTIYNADGSEALMCGNGLTCFALFIDIAKYNENDRYYVITKAGVREIKKDNNLYYVNIGSVITFSQETVRINELNIPYYLVDVGNKHAVIANFDIDDEDVKLLEKELECNIDIVEYASSHQINLRTYERGVGWTFGCGTGVSASFAIGRKYFEIERSAVVYQRGGKQMVSEENGDIILCGGASMVFEGEYLWKE